MMSLAKPNVVSEKLPASAWLQHKDTLYRLYIAENKPLSIVKLTMEDKYGFQTQRLCDYEVALRDVLRFRKNLKREEWRAIGILISARKRQAKESEVIWNNIPFEARKLRKELLRNSQPRSDLTRKVNPKLPQGLIIRTPPRSPATCAAVLLPSLGAQLANVPTSSTEDVSGRGGHPFDLTSADETIEEVQPALFEAGEFGVSPYRKLRGNLPFNRCMSRIVDLAQSLQVHFCMPNVETWTPVSPRLFGANPSWELFGGQIYYLSNNRFCIDTEDVWFLKWIAISADFTLLRSFFSINSPTAGAVYECLLRKAKYRRMTDLVRILFALRPILTPNNPMSVNDAEFVRAVITMGSWSDDGLDLISACLSNKPPRSITETVKFKRLTSSSVLIAASRADITTLRVLVDAGWKVKPRSQEADPELIGRLISRICNWALQEENGLMDYIQLLIRGGVLEATVSSQCSDDHRPQVVAEAHAIGSITWDELVMICPPTARQTLQMALMALRADQGSGISRAAVFTVAQDGAFGLRSYLEDHRGDDPFLIRVTLEECLLFAAIVNDSKTISCLLEVGVDPHVALLSNNQERYQKGNLPWDPSIVAAAAGNLEVLSLLLSQTNLWSFLDIAPIHELVHPKKLPKGVHEDVMGRELCRLSNLHLSYLHAQARKSKLAAEGSLDDRVPWDALNNVGIGRSFKALEYIRNVANSNGYGQKVDLAIVNAAVCRQCTLTPPISEKYLPHDVLLMQGLIEGHLEYNEQGMDLLHLSIRNDCSFTVVRYLSDKGLKVHSHLGGTPRNSMLHDALLSNSPDRSKIVEFLLREGADYKACGDGLSILEASLWNCDYVIDGIPEYLRIFKRLLDAGATPHQWPPRKGLSKWRPLIGMLLEMRASDDLILQVVDAGAPLDVCGHGHRQYGSNMTSLQAAIWHKRERLAQELLRRGADVHAPASPQFGLTALQAACLCDLPIPFLEYLLVAQGVEINEPPAQIMGVTSLVAAVLGGSLNTVEFLLDHGADVNATCRFSRVLSDDGKRFWTPLDIAVSEGSLDTVEFLLKAGGRSGKAGLGGAIRLAASRGHYAILSILRSWNKKYGRQTLDGEALWQRNMQDRH